MSDVVTDEHCVDCHADKPTPFYCRHCDRQVCSNCARAHPGAVASEPEDELLADIPMDGE